MLPSCSWFFIYFVRTLYNICMLVCGVWETEGWGNYKNLIYTPLTPHFKRGSTSSFHTYILGGRLIYHPLSCPFIPGTICINNKNNSEIFNENIFNTLQLKEIVYSWKLLIKECVHRYFICWLDQVECCIIC